VSKYLSTMRFSPGEASVKTQRAIPRPGEGHAETANPALTNICKARLGNPLLCAPLELKLFLDLHWRASPRVLDRITREHGQRDQRPRAPATSPAARTCRRPSLRNPSQSRCLGKQRPASSRGRRPQVGHDMHFRFTSLLLRLVLATATTVSLSHYILSNLSLRLRFS
jgi:hypothetical protein